MAKSLYDKVQDFRYTQEQKSELTELVPEPKFPSKEHPSWLERYSKSAAHFSPNQFKAEEVAYYLEISAKTLMGNKLQVNDASPKLEGGIRNISEHARQLLEYLDPNGPNKLRYARYYSKIIYDSEPYDFASTMLLEKLRLVANKETEILKYLENLFRSEFEKFQDKDWACYVNEVAVHWFEWTGEEVSGSKAGGKFARFLVEAVNPVAKFATNELGIKLRLKGALYLTEESAASTIRRYIF